MPACQLTCQSNVVVSKDINKPTDRPSSPHIGANSSLCGVRDPCYTGRQLTPLSLLLALCSPVKFSVASLRFLPMFKIASGTFPVDFPGSAC